MKSVFDKKTVVVLSVVVAVLIAAELVLSNFTALMLAVRGNDAIDVPLTEDSVTASGAVIPVGDGTSVSYGMRVSGYGSLTIDVEGVDIYCVRLDSHGLAAYCTFSAYITDDSSAEEYRKTGTYRLLPDVDGSFVFGVDSAGPAKKLRITFDSNCSGMRISGISLNATAGFGFNVTRFVLCLIIAVLCVFIVRKKLYRTLLDTSRPLHIILIVTVAVLTSASAVIGSVKEMGLDKYPFENGVETYSCYQQQCDAFMKGRLDLDIPFDADALSSLDNPYDYYERRDKSEDFGKLWDRAYYDGKVYSYFGVAPVLLGYLPICAITGSMPRDGTVSLIFTLAATAAIVLALLKLLEYFKIKPPFLLLLLAIPAVCGASMLYVLNVHPSMYYLAVISGILFFALLVLFSIYAVLSQSVWKRRLFLVLTGVSAVLVVASRPNIFIFALMLIPIYIRFFFRESRPVSAKLIDFACAAMPIILGAAAIMWYNYARFASPFDFGSTRQLTFADMSRSSIVPYKLLPSIYHFFIQPIGFTADFPFMDIAANDLAVYRNYEYIYGTAGALNFPAVWGFFGAGTVSRGDKVKRATFILAGACAVIVAFADFCLAGSHIRYMGDIMLPLVLIGALIILDLASRGDKDSVGLVYKFAVFAFIASWLVSTALLFNNEADNIRVLAPRLFRFFEGIFI